jgi:hypothetical protein
MEHRTVDGYDITEGGTYWDNGLNLVTVTKLEVHADTNYNPDNGPIGAKTWWHETTGGLTDDSRLVKFHTFTREEATDPNADTCTVETPCLVRATRGGFSCPHNGG